MISELIDELKEYCIFNEYSGCWNDQLSCKIKEAGDIIDYYKIDEKGDKII